MLWCCCSHTPTPQLYVHAARVTTGFAGTDYHMAAPGPNVTWQVNTATKRGTMLFVQLQAGTIDSATLTFDGVDSEGDFDVTIDALLTQFATPPTSSLDFDAADLTIAQVSWDAPLGSEWNNRRVTTADLKAVLQEIIDSAGFDPAHWIGLHFNSNVAGFPNYFRNGKTVTGPAPGDFALSIQYQ